MEKYARPVKYLYMGANAASSNIALPTTRIVYALKVRKERRAREARGETLTGPVSLHQLQKRGDPRGRLWAAARLLNRLAGAALRQGASWVYQARGFIVVYDRHYLFDFTPAGVDRRRLSERVHRWLLEHFYPKPGLALFLDAPPEVLIARKHEVSAPYLEERRRAFLQRGATIENFYVIDASQSAEEVYEVAAEAITSYLEQRGRRRRGLQWGLSGKTGGRD